MPYALPDPRMSRARTLCRLWPAVLLLGAAPGPDPSHFTPGGALIEPAGYREWIFLSSGFDMSYTAAAPMAGDAMFDNVFVDPASWAGFRKTGHWPDGTMLVLESRGAASRGSINQHGQYQTSDLMGLEVHIRDERRFAGGWGFFAFDGAAPASLIPCSARCYACHQAHGAVDTTFTQFYPTAKPIAVQAGTFSQR
jgi:hypothetical protein